MQPPISPDKPEKLLVCTDGSEDSQAALAGAMALARDRGSQIYLLQVVQIIPEFEAAAPDLMARVGEEVRQQLEAVKAEAAQKGVALETRMSRSISVFSAILQEAEQIQPEMIVMGRHGRTGLARLLIGSVTARVIGHSPCNVLVVPRGAAVSFDRILIASDGSPCSNARVRRSPGPRQTVGEQAVRGVRGHGRRGDSPGAGDCPPDVHLRQSSRDAPPGPDAPGTACGRRHHPGGPAATKWT